MRTLTRFRDVRRRRAHLQLIAPGHGRAGGPINFDGSSADLKIKMFCARRPLASRTPGAHHCGTRTDPLYNPDQIYNTIGDLPGPNLDHDDHLERQRVGRGSRGAVYAPKGIVTLNGNGGSLIVDQIIANQFNIMGTGNIEIKRRRLRHDHRRRRPGRLQLGEASDKRALNFDRSLRSIRVSGR